MKTVASAYLLHEPYCCSSYAIRALLREYDHEEIDNGSECFFCSERLCVACAVAIVSQNFPEIIIHLALLARIWNAFDSVFIYTMVLELFATSTRERFVKSNKMMRDSSQIDSKLPEKLHIFEEYPLTKGIQRIDNHANFIRWCTRISQDRQHDWTQAYDQLWTDSTACFITIYITHIHWVPMVTFLQKTLSEMTKLNVGTHAHIHRALSPLNVFNAQSRIFLEFNMRITACFAEPWLSKRTLTLVDLVQASRYAVDFIRPGKVLVYESQCMAQACRSCPSPAHYSSPSCVSDNDSREPGCGSHEPLNWIDLLDQSTAFRHYNVSILENIFSALFVCISKEGYEIAHSRLHKKQSVHENPIIIFYDFAVMAQSPKNLIVSAFVIVQVLYKVKKEEIADILKVLYKSAGVNIDDIDDRLLDASGYFVSALKFLNSRD